MKCFKYLFTTLLILAGSAHAGEVKQLNTEPEIIKFGLTLDLPELDRREVRDVVNGAFALTSVYAPKNLKLENVETIINDSELNPAMDVAVIVTNRKQAEPLLASALSKGYVLNAEADAVTVLLPDRPTVNIVTYLFWDKLKYENRMGLSVNRPDTFVRTTVAFAHELLGNVIFYKRKMKSQIEYLKFTQSGTPQSRQAQQEVFAFTAGLQFTEKVLEKSNLLPSEKLINDFKSALTREKEALQDWQNQWKSLNSEAVAAEKSHKVVELNQFRKSCPVVFGGN